MADAPKRHIFVPDMQHRPETPQDHVSWCARYIVEMLPDVLVVGGDWFDFASLSSHDTGIPMEGRRYKDDLDCGNKAFADFCAPIEAEQARRIRGKKKPWRVRKIALLGNHEIRADRVASQDPKLYGSIGSADCDFRDFERHPFLERVWVDGVCYSHYFQNFHSSRPIGGKVSNRLSKIGASFIAGHEQGYDHGCLPLACGKTIRGIVAGSCYLHREDYRGNQGQRHWRGLIVLNEVEDGDFSFMDVTLDYLCRKYEGVRLREYMDRKYPYQDWSHL